MLFSLAKLCAEMKSVAALFWKTTQLHLMLHELSHTLLVGGNWYVTYIIICIKFTVTRMNMLRGCEEGSCQSNNSSRYF